MKTSTLAFPALLITASLILNGCDQRARIPAQPRIGNVALVDLDEVAKRLGRDTSIVTELKNTNETLSSKLGGVATELQGQFQAERKTIGENPTDEQKLKLAQVERTLNAQLQQKQQEAQTELNSKRVALVTRFREEVKPIAQQIASDKGLDIVMIKSEALVLSSEPAVDITDDVVGKMISGSSTPVSSTSSTPIPTSTP